MSTKQKVLHNIAAHCHDIQMMPIPNPTPGSHNQYRGSGCTISYYKTNTNGRSRIIYRLSGSRFHGGPYELKQSTQFEGQWQLREIVKGEPASVGVMGAWLMLRQLRHIKEERSRRKSGTYNHRAAPI